MWRRQKSSNSFTAVVFRSDSITCSIIGHTQEKLYLKVYERTALNTYELVAGNICNPTRIKSIIKSFVAKNRMKNTDLLVSIDGSGIFQTIIDLTKATPERTDFRIVRLHALVWDYLYLYPKDDGLFSFYLGGIPQSLLAQYKLLFTSLQLQPCVISTELTAHLQLYRYLYGTAFRTSQLAHDMQCNNNRLEHYFAPETIKRLAPIPLDLSAENSYVITALGLGALGKKLYEH